MLSPTAVIIQVAYHGTPLKAYEVFITALQAQYLEKGLILPQLEDQNPAGKLVSVIRIKIMFQGCSNYFSIIWKQDVLYVCNQHVQKIKNYCSYVTIFKFNHFILHFLV